MTSSTDARHATGDATRRRRRAARHCRSMWRLFKLGYRARAGLLVVAVVVTVLIARARRAARAVAEAARRRRGRTGTARRVLAAAARARRSRSRSTWVLSVVVDACAAPVPRQGDDRAGDPRRATAGVDRRRSSTTSGPSTSTGSRCCATRCSCSTTCTCRCSATLGWIAAARASPSCCSASMHPALVLLAVFARPDRARPRRAPADRARRSRSAARRTNRLARHLFTHRDHRRRRARRCASPASARALVDAPARRRGSAGTRPIAAARWRTAAWHALAWAVFGAGFVGAVVFVAVGLDAHRRRGAAACSPPARGCRRTSARTVGEIGFLRGIWLDGVAAARLARGLRGRGQPRRRTRRRPTGSSDGIRFEHVSFTLPGHRAGWCSTTSTSTLPAGTVVAIVGENGAGKTTLVKLLAKLYEPTSGRITVDGVDLGAIRADEWRHTAGRRVPGLLPVRVRARARPSASATSPASTTRRAVARRGRSRRRRRRHRRGCQRASTPSSGRRGPTASTCRFGQWQKLALARGFMRDDAAAARARRADRGARRRDRARAVRALRRRAPRRARRDGRHHGARVAPVLDGAHGRPDRRARRRARRRGRHARRADGERRPVRRAVRDPRARPTASPPRVHRSPLVPPRYGRASDRARPGRRLQRRGASAHAGRTTWPASSCRPAARPGKAAARRAAGHGRRGARGRPPRRTRAGVRLLPQGANTGLVGASVPPADDPCAVLSLDRLAGRPGDRPGRRHRSRARAGHPVVGAQRGGRAGTGCSCRSTSPPIRRSAG